MVEELSESAVYPLPGSFRLTHIIYDGARCETAELVHLTTDIPALRPEEGCDVVWQGHDHVFLEDVITLQEAPLAGRCDVKQLQSIQDTGVTCSGTLLRLLTRRAASQVIKCRSCYLAAAAARRAR